MPQQPRSAPRIPAGAIDLSALKAPPARPTAQGAAGAGKGSAGANPFVVDVTEATFETDVIAASMQVPVVVDFWADWCEPCKQLSPVLEKLALEYGGRFVLAKVDVEANQRLAALIQVQALPTVMAVLGQSPMQLFQGALPEAQVRQVIEELLKVATANGISGRMAPRQPGPEVADEDGVWLRYPEAMDALERGDLDAAEAGYTEALSKHPGDPEAEQGLAQVRLLRRVSGADPGTARQQAADRPTDVAAQCLAADVDLAEGAVEEAFARLVNTVRITAGADRDAAREHLLSLFLVAGPDDPRVAQARRALASALF
jgi:putative thioredoxin